MLVVHLQVTRPSFWCLSAFGSCYARLQLFLLYPSLSSWWRQLTNLNPIRPIIVWTHSNLMPVLVAPIAHSIFSSFALANIVITRLWSLSWNLEQACFEPFSSLLTMFSWLPWEPCPFSLPFNHITFLFNISTSSLSSYFSFVTYHHYFYKYMLKKILACLRDTLIST